MDLGAWAFFVAVVAVIVGLVGWVDYYPPVIDLPRPVTIDGTLNVTGAVMSETYYMVASFHNDSEPVLTITDNNFYPLPFDSFYGYGFMALNQTSFMALVPGRYAVHFSISFAAETLGGQYSIEIAKNGAGDDNSETYRTLGTANSWGSAGAHGVISLETGDIVTLIIKDEEPPGRSVLLKAHQLLLTRVGS